MYIKLLIFFILSSLLILFFTPNTLLRSSFSQLGSKQGGGGGGGERMAVDLKSKGKNTGYLRTCMVNICQGTVAGVLFCIN